MGVKEFTLARIPFAGNKNLAEMTWVPLSFLRERFRLYSIDNVLEATTAKRKL